MYRILEVWTYGGHSTSLYLTVISTLGNVHNTVGCSFPLLPPPCPFKEDCIADGKGDMTIPGTFTVVKFTHAGDSFSSGPRVARES